MSKQKQKFEVTRIHEYPKDGNINTLVDVVPVAKGGGAMRNPKGQIMNGFFKTDSSIGSSWKHIYSKPDRQAKTAIQKEVEAERDEAITARKKFLFGENQIEEGITFEAEVEDVNGFLVIQ